MKKYISYNAGGFQYPASTIHRFPRWKIHEETLDLNYILDQIDLNTIDSQNIFQHTATEQKEKKTKLNI